MPTAKAQLLALLKDRCYKEGDFTLASGARSSYYLDTKLLSTSSVGAALIGQVLYDRLKTMDIDAIGGLEIGAIPLTTATVYTYHQQGRVIEGFFVRNEAKGHGTRKLIEGRLRSGSRCVVVDDVATSGASIMRAVNAVRKAECVPVLVLALVDRLAGAAELFKREGVPYETVYTVRDFAGAHEKTPAG